MALAKERDTKRRDGKTFADPVKGGVKIYAGSLTMLDDSGRLVPGATATGQVARGRAKATYDNTLGADGALIGESEAGCFRYENDGTCTRAGDDIGKTAYIVDDQTVADNDGGATRSAAGKIADIDADGVWVEVTGF